MSLQKRQIKCLNRWHLTISYLKKQHACEHVHKLFHLLPAQISSQPFAKPPVTESVDNRPVSKLNNSHFSAVPVPMERKRRRRRITHVISHITAWKWVKDDSFWLRSIRTLDRYTRGIYRCTRNLQ